MNTPISKEINDAINESWRHAPRPKRSGINKILAFLRLAKPTCEGLFTYKTTQNGVRTIELQAAISMDIDPTDPPDPLVYTCACNEIKNRTCPSFKLVRERLTKAAAGEGLCMLSTKPKIEPNVNYSDIKTGSIDDSRYDVVVTNIMNSPHWCNQQLYPVVIYRTPGIDNAKYSANSSNGQCNRLQQSDFVHAASFSNSRIEKDSML